MAFLKRMDLLFAAICILQLIHESHSDSFVAVFARIQSVRTSAKCDGEKVKVDKINKIIKSCKVSEAKKLSDQVCALRCVAAEFNWASKDYKGSDNEKKLIDGMMKTDIWTAKSVKAIAAEFSKAKCFKKTPKPTKDCVKYIPAITCVFAGYKKACKI